MPHDHVVTVNVPFESQKQAQIAQRTMAVDPVLKKDEISVTYAVDEKTLVCRFAGESDRVIRVAISNAIDNIKTVIETIEEFEGQKETVFAN